LKTLCEHARSVNAQLRLNALWALKHLVLAAEPAVKKTCLGELGEGWLIQLICDDQEDEAVTKSTLETSALVLEADEDTDMDHGDDYDDTKVIDYTSTYSRPATATSTTGHIPELRSDSNYMTAGMAQARLAQLRDAELSPSRRARKDDIAVQEQGLDFIRNFIGGGKEESTSTPAMIDFLFNALGQDRVFSILASKLQTRVINRRERRSGNGEARVIPPQPEIIASVCFILVHIAASEPRHRQLLIAQTELLRSLVPFFNHQHKPVREALCWLSYNLTWEEDKSDIRACANRALELKKLGFLAKLEALERDPELDIRERAKSACHNMRREH
jgi:hypothetical protein